MKRILLITGLLAMVMMPAVLPAADNPLAGVVEFGSEEGTGGRVWKSGRIDLIHEDGLVVGDIGYVFTKDTKFYSTTGTALSWMNFQPGMTVKFVLENDLQTVVSVIKQ